MNINDSFVAHRLFLNVGKTKYSLFRKLSRVDDLLLQLPKITKSINNQETKRTSYTKFLGILFGVKIFHGKNI